MPQSIWLAVGAIVGLSPEKEAGLITCNIPSRSEMCDGQLGRNLLGKAGVGRTDRPSTQGCQSMPRNVNRASVCKGQMCVLQEADDLSDTTLFPGTWHWNAHQYIGCLPSSTSAVLKLGYT